MAAATHIRAGFGHHHPTTHHCQPPRNPRWQCLRAPPPRPACPAPAAVGGPPPCQSTPRCCRGASTAGCSPPSWSPPRPRPSPPYRRATPPPGLLRKTAIMPNRMPRRMKNMRGQILIQRPLYGQIQNGCLVQIGFRIVVADTEAEGGGGTAAGWGGGGSVSQRPF